MDNFNIEMVKENSIVKFINDDKNFLNGQVKKVDKNCLGIVIDVNQSTYKEFKKNENIQLIFIYENQALRCSATVIGSKMGGSEQALIIDIPKVIFKIERREFERLDIVLDAKYSQLPEGIEYEKLSLVNPVFFKHYKKTCTIDISAGGVNIATSILEKASKFALLELSICDEKITILCGMVRSESMNSGKQKKLAYKFVDIENQHRQLIIDYVNTKSKEQ